MTTTATAELAQSLGYTEATITLAPVGGRVAVMVNGETLDTVKDGGQIVRNAERVLTAAGVHRVSGYSLNGERHLTATGYAR